MNFLYKIREFFERVNESDFEKAYDYLNENLDDLCKLKYIACLKKGINMSVTPRNRNKYYEVKIFTKKRIKKIPVPIIRNMILDDFVIFRYYTYDGMLYDILKCDYENCIIETQDEYYLNMIYNFIRFKCEKTILKVKG